MGKKGLFLKLLVPLDPAEQDEALLGDFCSVRSRTEASEHLYGHQKVLNLGF